MILHDKINVCPIRMSYAKNYLVKDYMRTPVKTVSPQTTLRVAVERMIQEKTNGLVVVDDQQKVVGILSSWDVIQYLVPDYLEEDKHLAPFESGALFAKRTLELQNDSIDKFMTTSVHSVKPTSSIMEAATTLSEYGIRQLPVVDEEGTVIGYLNRTDLKHVIGEILHITT